MARDATADEVKRMLEKEGHEIEEWPGDDTENYIRATPTQHLHSAELPGSWQIIAVVRDGAVHLSRV